MRPGRLTCVSLAILGFVRPVLATDTYDDEGPRQEPEPATRLDRGREERKEEGLSAGGLDAPEALPEQGENRSQIERDLDEAEARDSGRGLEFVWITSDVGYRVQGVATFGQDNLVASSDRTSAAGLAIGAGAGLRLLYFTMGARFRYGFLSHHDYLAVLGELGLKVPLGAFEPFAAVAVGYGSVRGWESTDLHLPHLHGLDLSVSGGADYYLSDSFSVGGRFDLDLLFLRRRAVSESDSCRVEDDCPYLKSGSGVGGGTTVSLSLGLHF